MSLSVDTANTKDGILVYPASGCLGFHLLSALLRLQKNCKGLNLGPAELGRNPPCPVITFDFFSADPSGWMLKEADLGCAVLILENELIDNSCPTPDRIQKLLAFSKQLQSTHKQIHLIGVFPYNSPAENIRDFLAVGDKTSVFLCPAVFGFRDHSLMELSLKNRQTPSALLKKQMPREFDVGLVSAPDVVGFLISAIQNSTTYLKTFVIPEQVKSTVLWIDTFKKYFGHRDNSFLAKILLPLKSSPLRSIAPKKLFQDLPPDAIKALDAFPSPLQSLDRYMKNSFDNQSRNPEQPLHFPTRRAL